MEVNGLKQDYLIQGQKQIHGFRNAAAELLEFEIAARLRDELKELKKEMKEIDIDG